MSTRHQAKRRRLYGPRRHDLVERRVREPARVRADRAEDTMDRDVEAAGVFVVRAQPAPLTTLED